MCAGVQSGEILLACAIGSLYASQMFFCTGHFNEFAGLHYTAGMHSRAAPVHLCGTGSALYYA